MFRLGGCRRPGRKGKRYSSDQDKKAMTSGKCEVKGDPLIRRPSEQKKTGRPTQRLVGLFLGVRGEKKGKAGFCCLKLETTEGKKKVAMAARACSEGITGEKGTESTSTEILNSGKGRGREMGIGAVALASSWSLRAKGITEARGKNEMKNLAWGPRRATR